MQPKDVINFWFADEVSKKWFNSTPEFDAEIKQRFESVWQDARQNRLSDWENTAEGALALVIVLDQFPLNMFRGQPQSFATEAMSRQVSQRAIEQGFDKQLQDKQRAFMYLPFMHSESPEDQTTSVRLFKEAGLNDNLHWAKHHQDIVARFGRFPHRNAILGRESSVEELQWLDSDEAFKG
jgi:uncharacterized protein (DUF924 family)